MYEALYTVGGWEHDVYIFKCIPDDVYPKLVDPVKLHEEPHSPKVERIIILLGTLMHNMILLEWRNVTFLFIFFRKAV